MTHKSKVVIVDFGSQYIQLIARRVREMSVYCEIVPCSTVATEQGVLEFLGTRPSAVILSGGPQSVYAEDAPTVHPSLFEKRIPILGICYGLQVMAHVLGGKVERSEAREYGKATMTCCNVSSILNRFKGGEEIVVWMSHGDKLARVPPGFDIDGVSDNTPYCVISDPKRKLFGIQFHPEVAHTPEGMSILKSFVFDIAGCYSDWVPANFVWGAIAKVKATVKDGRRAICGLSGGVDSSVAAAICFKAIGERLTCVFVDNGLLRRGEREQVEKMFLDYFPTQLIVVDAADEFLDALSGVTDPERKRKIIGKVFIDVFEREAKKIDRVDFLVQGTLYPDIIESLSHNGPSAVIKSHHNVGGLPEKMGFGLIEPLREMFKDEVRVAGAYLGMPRDFVWRQPFPGPGLAIRCLGEVTRERLETLRHADSVVDAEIRAAGLYDSVWQSFCVLLPVRSVGVMGDARTYEETCAVRAVTSTDGMTADWARLPHEVLARISTRIVNEVKGINRVVYDISSKPASTIEWE